MKNDFHSVVSAPFGKLGIKIDFSEEALCGIEFLPKKSILKPSNISLVKEIVSQLDCYFSDPNFKFNIPLRFNGTELRKKIWLEMCMIPTGKTLTYSDLAKRVKTHARVIGNACRCNPIPIIIPCHRVIAANGLGGFFGTQDAFFLNIKRWLLNHEKVDL